jgi:hypothetical protein
MKAAKYLLTILASGAAFWLPPFLIGIYVIYTYTGVDSLGYTDDAPLRAASLLIGFSPIAIIIFGSAIAVTAGTLRLFKCNSLKALLLTSAGLGCFVGIVFAALGYNFGGAKDAIFSFTSFGVLTFSCFGLGSTVWWFLEQKTIA